MLKKAELLAPAGDLIKLKYAIKFGADAVYAGLPSYSLRVKENKFKYKDLIEGIKFIKENNRKIYLTANIYPRKNFNERKFLEIIGDLYSKEIDALIMSDPGLIKLILDNYDISIHLSVQANATNYLAVKFWKDLGVKRVILPRELTLDEIKHISEKVEDIELEFFVHGSICMAYSGRCLISAYLNRRHANLGQCANCCRWKYKIWLEEEKREGQLMLVEEDKEGTYFFNSRDFCLIKRIPDLLNAGVSSFKIEGRNKTEYYISITTAVYRKAINDLKEGKIPNWNELIKELETAPHRPWLMNFMDEPSDPWLQCYNYSTSIQTHIYLAHLVEGEKKDETLFKALIKNKISKGDVVEVVREDSKFKVKINRILRVIKDKYGKEIALKEVNEISGGLEAYLEIEPLDKKNKIKGYELIRKKKN